MGIGQTLPVVHQRRGNGQRAVALPEQQGRRREGVDEVDPAHGPELTGGEHPSEGNGAQRAAEGTGIVVGVVEQAGAAVRCR